MRRWMALFLLLVFVMGASPQCQFGDPGKQCETVRVLAYPGTRVELENPCGPDWEGLLHASLCDTIAGMYLRVERRDTGTRVWLCAEEGVPYILDSIVPYAVSTDGGDRHLNYLKLRTGDPLVATPTATPETIEFGDTAWLDVDVQGGWPPYEYSWRGSTPVSDPTIPNPFVKPRESSRWFLAVTDQWGNTVRDHVDVDVRPLILASADPDTITEGESTRLSFVQKGGGKSVRVQWYPTSSLDDPEAYSPTATPPFSLSYLVVVTLIDDVSGVGFVHVVVLPATP